MSKSYPTILFSEMTPPPGREDVFNRWYNEAHIPARMKAPGFIGAQRYRDGATANYLAVYEMSAPGALTTPEYNEIKSRPNALTKEMLATVSNFTRYLATELSAAPDDVAVFEDAPVLYAVFFTVPEDRLGAFDTWYQDELIELLREDPRWLGIRRFNIFDGAPHPFNRLALHYLAERDVLKSAARQRARNAPLRSALANEAWFKAHSAIFNKIGARFHAGT